MSVYVAQKKKQKKKKIFFFTKSSFMVSKSEIHTNAHSSEEKELSWHHCS